MKSSKSSIAAKRRMGKTKKERSERAKELALRKASKMSLKQRKKQSKIMLDARYKNKK